MSELVKLMCPSCGSRLDSSEKQNSFNCPHCGNKYLFKQEGNSISLIPVLEKMQKGGTVVLGDSASVVHAENVYMGGQGDEPKNKKQTIQAEKVECPICGKMVNLDETFRCKNCNRSNICLTHQDPKTFFCSECTQQIHVEEAKVKNAIVLRRNGIASLILGGLSSPLIILSLLGARNSTFYLLILIVSIPALITGVITLTRSKGKSIFGWIGIAPFIFSLVIFIIRLL
jgi:DNA-directed RNA polymerase subunit RPC12/RpoP